MQLFSIGLYELHWNGTVQRDSNGEPIETYDNGDIMAFARIWTGMKAQAGWRTNLETPNGAAASLVDPMRIQMSDRDVLPKAKSALDAVRGVR